MPKFLTQEEAVAFGNRLVEECRIHYKSGDPRSEHLFSLPMRELVLYAVGSLAGLIACWDLMLEAGVIKGEEAVTNA